MKVSKVFASRYLKVTDLKGRERKLTISGCDMEQVGQDGAEKPVSYFAGASKGFVLNRTNADTIAEAYGDDSKDWIGREVVLFPAKTQFGGKKVDRIRVRIPDNGAEPAKVLPTRGGAAADDTADVLF